MSRLTYVNWERDLIYLAGRWPKHALWALRCAYFAVFIRHLALEIQTEPYTLDASHKLDIPYLGQHDNCKFSVISKSEDVANILGTRLSEPFTRICDIKTLRCVRICPPAIRSDATPLEEDEFGFVGFQDHYRKREERRLNEQDLNYLLAARTFVKEYASHVTKYNVVLPAALPPAPASGYDETPHTQSTPLDEDLESMVDHKYVSSETNDGAS